jgi:hypothetical protein
MNVDVTDVQWLDATKPCDTCGGTGRVQGMNHGPADLLFPCPNCDMVAVVTKVDQ